MSGIHAPCKVIRPTVQERAVLVTIPHSGTWIPEEIAAQCTDHHLRSLRNTDWHLDKLNDFLPSLGVTVLQAQFSRYVIDPNRAIREPLIGPQKTHPISLVNTWQEAIYTKTPEDPELRSRVENYYNPFHAQLSSLLRELCERHPQVLLLDLHSFMGPLDSDVCLGNGSGETCSSETLKSIEKSFQKEGFSVALNEVFTGGYIVRHYSKLTPNIQALQIELRYSQYLRLDELDLPEPPNARVSELSLASDRLRRVFVDLFNLI